MGSVGVRAPLGFALLQEGAHAFLAFIRYAQARNEAGGELIQREDDNEETISNRLDVYRENTEPLVKFYRERGKLKTVAAEGTIDEVYGRLLEALQ